MTQADKGVRVRGERMRWLAFITGSYVLDAALLALFWVAGTVAGWLPLAYGAAAALILGANYAIYASGWNLQRRDPNLTTPFVAVAAALQFAVVLAAPQIAFPWLANLVTVFAFGILWLPVGAAAALWAGGVAAAAAVIAAIGERAAVPAGTPLEQALVWACFSLILGRFVFLSTYANDLRKRLAQSRRELAASLDQVRELAQYDEMTRTLNRRSLLARLEQETGRARRISVPFCVALLDLDHFKKVNDTFGHAVGDEVLRRFTQTVGATMRETDVFGRYGGEEFLLLLMAADPQAALAPLERIRLAVALHDWNAVAPGLELTTSIGVAGLQPEESVAQLLRRADEALYEAKAAGRNRVIAKG